MNKGSEETLLAYQIAFDLEDIQDQQFILKLEDSFPLIENFENTAYPSRLIFLKQILMGKITIDNNLQ